MRKCAAFSWRLCEGFYLVLCCDQSRAATEKIESIYLRDLLDETACRFNERHFARGLYEMRILREESRVLHCLVVLTSFASDLPSGDCRAIRAI